MKGLIYKSLFALAIAPLFAIKSDPWIPPPFQFNADIGYSFSWFPFVNDGFNPTNYHSHINQVDIDVSGSFTPRLFAELHINLNETRKVNFGFESIAPCIKYQLLNDLTGDTMALLVGTYFRFVADDNVRDVATPYGGAYNFDFLLSAGKEYDTNGELKGRAYGLFDVGVALQGMPWVIADFMGEAIFLTHNYLRVGVEGYFGFGDKTKVNVDDFYGWASVQHNSLDVKMGYAYVFDVWGELAFLYKRRVVAVAYPEFLNYFSLSYEVSFSF